MSAVDYEFAQHRDVWSSLPVDGVGYLPISEMLGYPDDVLRSRIDAMARERYQGWRNAKGLWRKHLGLDDTHGKTILDYGCGVGLEALQFASNGNAVILADINPDGLRLAERVLRLHSVAAAGTALIAGAWPFVECEPVDVFYSNGVLHHTPALPEILRRARELLKPSGEVRLMLYTDRGWRRATGTNPPAVGARLDAHPGYETFCGFFDGIGNYSEPWWADKLAAAVDGHLQLVSWDYITQDGRYAAAVLR